MPVWKTFACKKGISFIGNSGIKEFHLGKRKLYLNVTVKATASLQKNLLHHINKTD